MKFALSTLVFAAFSTLMVAAQHQPYYLTKPNPGESVEAGKDFRVEWLNGQDEDVTVFLLEGSGRENMLPTGYQVKGNGADGGVDFKIPADSDPKGRYALRINYVSDKGKKAQAFSSAFQVTGGASAEEKNQPASAPSATEAKSSAAAAESSPAAKEDDKTKDEEKVATKDEEKVTAKDEEKDAEKKSKESTDATATPEAQQGKEDEESSATSVKFVATMMAIPAIAAGAFLA